jgi:uncharacterized protein YecT (DUF1311 family)
MRLVAAIVAVTMAAGGAVLAQEPVDPKDRAALNGCLDKARREGTRPEQCIGTVEGPCLKKPDAETTIGMKECTGREINAWDERLNKTYRDLLAGDLGQLQTERVPPSGKGRKITGADILRDAQRAWIVARDKKCDAAGLPMEGGTGAGLLTMACVLQETARQVLWLEDLKAER